MRLISWNISYQNKIESKIDLIKANINDETIIVLLEVLPNDYKKLSDTFSSDFSIYYSLNIRKPSSFDTRSRKLGVLILVSKSFSFLQYTLLDRTPFPDRTGLLTVFKNEHKITIMGLHSVTGVDYKKTKSVQFFSFAEAVNTFKPDFVMFDANEPKIDHPDIEKIEFASNRDKGKGAKTFFDEMNKNDLQDAYRMVSDSKTIPLTVSYKTNKSSKAIKDNFNKRYDHVFVNTNKYSVDSVSYLYDEAIGAGSDHAMVICDVSSNKKITWCGRDDLQDQLFHITLTGIQAAS